MKVKERRILITPVSIKEGKWGDHVSRTKTRIGDTDKTKNIDEKSISNIQICRKVLVPKW